MTTSTHFINKDSTNQTIYVDIIQDAGATTPGDPLTGLAYTDMTIYYNRPLAAATALTAATQTVTGAHSDGGFVEIDSTNMPGHYRVDLSDAICATGVNDAYVTLTSTNSAPHTAHIVLTDTNAAANVTQWNGTAVGTPDTAGYPVVTIKDGTGQGEIATTSGAVDNVTLVATTTTNTDMLTVASILNATSASYITAGTVGEAIALGSAALVDSTITGTPTSTSFTFTGGNTNNGFYDDQLCYILSGTGAGQVKPVLSSTYLGGTTTITVDEAFTVTPAASDRFAVIVSHVHPLTQITANIDANSTQLAAIKTKTDSLTFTVANQVDVNLQSINDVAVTGDGSGTPFTV